MNDKTFEKINIKIVISIQQCTPLRNLSFYRTSDYGTKYAQKNMTDKKFEKNKH